MNRRFILLLLAPFYLCGQSASRPGLWCTEISEEAWGKAYALSDTTKQGRYYDASEIAMRETDFELRDREKVLGVYRQLTGDEVMMILGPRIDRLEEKLKLGGQK